VGPTRTPSDTFGQRLARARLQAGAARGRLFTQTELAGAVGVTPPTVSQYEADASEPALSMILKLAKALGVNPALLAFGGAYELVPAYGAPTASPRVAEPAVEPPRREDVAGARERQQAREGPKKNAAGGRPGPTRRPKR
jgi:transcriptional regulator with XRE-family HTH domain